ncbi:MAG TPA: hypothetical protein PKA06_10300 [Gemmatales bacterium]|nr:hypothetical protein [Gemmatales bacterium]HMP16558.1 hypothetical protein [Gemmatales bacterium]
MSKRITVTERRNIFQALVRAQDNGASVGESRQNISRRFHVTEYTLRKIEDEGIARQWPPLDEDDSPALTRASSQMRQAERN